MELYQILLIIIPFGIYLQWVRQKSKDFSEIINSKLKKHELKFISSTYSGFMKAGPFNRFEISFGKPQINSGSIQYENRIIVLLRLKLKRIKS